MPTNFAEKPREPVLTLNAVKGKDGVVGVRVFPVRASLVFARQRFPYAYFTFALLGGFRRPQCQARPNGSQQIHNPKQDKW